MSEFKQAPADPATGKTAAPAESGVHDLEPGTEAHAAHKPAEQPTGGTTEVGLHAHLGSRAACEPPSQRKLNDGTA